MEPSAVRAQPRIYNIEEKLMYETELISHSKEEIFSFDASPVQISMDSDAKDLNYRLFGNRIDGAKPDFWTSIKRNYLSCVKKPESIVSPEQIWEQLSLLGRKRGRKGKFLPKGNNEGIQSSFFDIKNKLN
jgi:hypothetical protein